MIHDLMVFLTAHIWYKEIFAIMTIESSFIPFPSEVAMIPAWIWVRLWTLNIFLVMISALTWVFIWTTINYLIWRYVWRDVILKYSKYFLIKEEVFYKSEKLFNKNRVLYTFLWRLIPWVRQLISIPAWMFKMPYLLFITASLAWTLIWISILTLLGYLFADNQDLISKYLKEITLVLVILILTYLSYILYKNFKKKK